MPVSFIKCLVILMFLWSAASPALSYVHSIDSSEAGHHQQADEQQEDTGSIACDHCCHFSAHSVGVLCQTIPERVDIHDPALSPYSITYHFLRASPPFRPPIFPLV